MKERHENKFIKDMFYDLSKQPFDFRVFETIRSFGKDIYSKRINIDEADQEQSDLLDYFFDFNSKTEPKSKKTRKEKKTFLIIFIKTNNRNRTENSFS